MEADKINGNFRLDDEDIAALGQPLFEQQEPFTSAEALHNRAAQRGALNAERVLGLPPGAADRDQLRSQVAKTAARLTKIMDISRPHLPGSASLGDQVENYLAN